MIIDIVKKSAINRSKHIVILGIVGILNMHLWAVDDNEVEAYGNQFNKPEMNQTVSPRDEEGKQ